MYCEVYVEETLLTMVDADVWVGVVSVEVGGVDVGAVCELCEEVDWVD